MSEMDSDLEKLIQLKTNLNEMDETEIIKIINSISDTYDGKKEGLLQIIEKSNKGGMYRQGGYSNNRRGGNYNMYGGANLNEDKINALTASINNMIQFIEKQKESQVTDNEAAITGNNDAPNNAANTLNPNAANPENSTEIKDTDNADPPAKPVVDLKPNTAGVEADVKVKLMDNNGQLNISVDTVTITGDESFPINDQTTPDAILKYIQGKNNQSTGSNAEQSSEQQGGYKKRTMKRRRGRKMKKSKRLYKNK